jgi:hypothetical protein
MRDRWSIERWHWIGDTQLHEDAHRCRGNGAGAMATLRTAPLNLLRLAGFQSIRASMQAVTHDITALLAMAGLIQSVSQAPWPGLSAWVEVGGIALFLCPKPHFPLPIST